MWPKLGYIDELCDVRILHGRLRRHMNEATIDMIWIQIIMQVWYLNLIRSCLFESNEREIDWNCKKEEPNRVRNTDNIRKKRLQKSNKYFSVEIWCASVLGFFLVVFFFLFRLVDSIAQSDSIPTHALNINRLVEQVWNKRDLNNDSG